MKDIHSLIRTVDLVSPAVYAATPSSPLVVDLADFEAAEVLLHIGAGGIAFDADNRIDFKLLHSDDGENFEGIESRDLIGTPAVGDGGIVKSLTAAHAAASLDQFGYRGGRRYLELIPTFAGTHGTGTPIAAAVIKGRPHQAIE
jgi:hypothetical protein